MNSYTTQKEYSLKLKDKLGLEVYEVKKSTLSMANDPLIKQRTAEARAFLQKAGIPDIEKFRSE